DELGAGGGRGGLDSGAAGEAELEGLQVEGPAAHVVALGVHVDLPLLPHVAVLGASGPVGRGGDGLGQAVAAAQPIGVGAAHAAPSGGEAAGGGVELELVAGAVVPHARPEVHRAPGVEAAAAGLGGVGVVVVRAALVGAAVEAPGVAEPAGEHA